MIFQHVEKRRVSHGSNIGFVFRGRYSDLLRGLRGVPVPDVIWKGRGFSQPGASLLEESRKPPFLRIYLCRLARSQMPPII